MFRAPIGQKSAYLSSERKRAHMKNPLKKKQEASLFDEDEVLSGVGADKTKWAFLTLNT